METRYSLDRDLSEARAMAEHLESYLLGDELYGSVGGMYGGDPDMPSLTVGALLLRVNRLRKLADLMSFDQRAILTEIEAEHDGIRQWNDAYMRKAHREAGARLHSLEAFFAECEDSPAACAEDYLPEALRRTMLEEIVDALKKYNMPTIDLGRSLQEHDAQLHRFTEPSTFIWDNELKVAYPQDKYWWLYHRPKIEEREQQQR
jgi:hypothetical protein